MFIWTINYIICYSLQFIFRVWHTAGELLNICLSHIILKVETQIGQIINKISTAVRKYLNPIIV